MKQNKNEELQSRRAFFKKAAKGALPILGAIALANMPIIAKASESTSNGCGSGCMHTCLGCYGSCTDVCTSCSGCQGTCKGMCYRAAY